MRRLFQFLLPLVLLFLLNGCYNKPAPDQDAVTEYSEQQLDSLSFQGKHHYTKNYNFIVDVDSLMLLSQQPEEIISEMNVDTFSVSKNDRIVVADIRTIPTDSIDSVWVQVAKDQYTFGWTHELSLLASVVPDDPISQFINFFSDTHILIFLIFLVLVVGIYSVVNIRRKNVPMVHFHDIDTFYPALLCIIVACSATFYASLQLFATEVWKHFYYHPTLNPFSVPPLLSVFLVSAWAIVIVGIAAVDDVFRKLPMGDAVLYLGGMGAVCAVNYVIFSVSTLYYVGYPLLAVYIVMSVRQFLKHSFKPYLCGNCGSQLRRKGRCPHCGTMNY